jgi:hypothetical protein
MQFMARELLDCFLSKAAREKFIHQPHHDLECFVYVLVYAVMRQKIEKLASAGRNNAKFRGMDDIYVETFGQGTPYASHSVRLDLSNKWKRYKDFLGSGDNQTSTWPHHIITEFLNIASKRYVSIVSNPFSNEPEQVPTPMDAKKMR